MNFRVGTKRAVEDMFDKMDEMLCLCIKETFGNDIKNFKNMNDEDLKVIQSCLSTIDATKKFYLALADTIDTQTLMLQDILSRMEKLEEKLENNKTE